MTYFLLKLPYSSSLTAKRRNFNLSYNCASSKWQWVKLPGANSIQKLNDDEVVTGQRKFQTETGKEMEKLFWTVLSHLNKSSWKPERMKDSRLNYNSILLKLFKCCSELHHLQHNIISSCTSEIEKIYIGSA